MGKGGVPKEREQGQSQWIGAGKWKGGKKGQEERFGKGKGKKSIKGAMPPELIGGVSHTDNNAPLCFGFNLGNCTDAQPGGRCNRGLHLCCAKGCVSKEHNFMTHPWE